MSTLPLSTCALFLIATKAGLAFQQVPFDWPRLAFPGNLTNFRRAADLNGDGHLDLVALNGHLTVPSFHYEVWLGDGQGNFTVAYQAALQGPHLGKYECAQLLDLSGDGRLDLVLCQEPTTNVAPAYLSVWPGEANGNFAATPMQIAIPGPTIALAIGDADGDSQLDLAVLRRDSLNSSVRYAGWLLSRPGQGYFQATEIMLPLGNEGSICALDVDQDGNADLACGTTTCFAVLNTVSNGVLSHVATWNLALNFTPSTLAATSSDLDGDGDADLLAFVARSDRAATIPLLTSSGFAMTQGASLERTLAKRVPLPPKRSTGISTVIATSSGASTIRRILTAASTSTPTRVLRPIRWRARSRRAAMVISFISVISTAIRCPISSVLASSIAAALASPRT